MRRVKLTPLLLPGLLLLAGCGSGPLANPFLQAIEVTLAPNTLTLPPGETARVQVTGRVAGAGGVVTGLKITPQDVPEDLTVTASTGAVTVTAKDTARGGTYSVPLGVTVPGGRGEAVLAVTVVRPVEKTAYSLTFTPSPVTLAQGERVRVAVNATREDGQPALDVRVTQITGALLTTTDSTDPLGLTVSAGAQQDPGAYVLQITTQDGQGRTQVTPLPVTLTTTPKETN